MKRLEMIGDEKHLVSENEAHPPIIIQPGDVVELYGVVVLRRDRERPRR